jgi:hypothetical protein
MSANLADDAAVPVDAAAALNFKGAGHIQDVRAQRFIRLKINIKMIWIAYGLMARELRHGIRAAADMYEKLNL